jgi:hypothetical protein
LAKELPAEHAVAFEPLIAAFELGDVLAGVRFSGPPDGTG